jgi:hypothetical protein
MVTLTVDGSVEGSVVEYSITLRFEIIEILSTVMEET